MSLTTATVGDRLRAMWATLRPLAAHDEGLAAGTGLLTGKVAEDVAPGTVACRSCGGPAVVIMVDLVDDWARLACTSCAHRWTVDGLPVLPLR